MIGCTVFNKVKVTQKNENILYIKILFFFKTSYVWEKGSNVQKKFCGTKLKLRKS